MPEASSPPAVIDFRPFQLDRRAALLRRDGVPIRLRPKTFAVLLYLAERPGELVTKPALLDAVWSDVSVTESVLRVSVAELRAVLGDDRATPRFIETVPRRGYRFIAQLGAARANRDEDTQRVDGGAARADGGAVGRVRERAMIAEWLRAARSGRRQMAFISGEAGIGKTTLVDVALRELQQASSDGFRIARGECIEHFGGGEPYLPVLESLAGLCLGDDAEKVRASLREHSPAWFLRELGADAAEPIDRGASDASTHQHTLNKLAASLEALATDVPLVLVLEDIHWSDYATLDLLSVLARRRQPARLLVLCTVRPVDAIVRGHPVADVKRELVRKGTCHEILLDGLSPSDVADYLAARLGGASLPDDVLQLFVARTGGNPFFLVTLVDHVLERGLLVRRNEHWELGGSVDLRSSAIPEGLLAVIEPRLERLTAEELRALETASVIGSEFAAHAIARAAERDGELGDVEYVEHLCDRLARREDILRMAGDSTWPDGTTSARYAFRHALYQQVAYQRIPSSTCRRLHQAIGEGLEAAFAGQTIDVASELAAHFERSRDLERAVRYHGEAAAHAGSRLAYQETRLHLQAAIDLLRSQPESNERLQQEMTLLHSLGWTLVSIHGHGDGDARRAFLRMKGLAERLQLPAIRLQAMSRLRSLQIMCAEYEDARRLSEESIVLAEELGDAIEAGNARTDLASARLHGGELVEAHELARHGYRLFDEASMQAVSIRLLLASTHSHLGQIALSREMVREAIACAEKLGNDYFRAFAATFGAASCASFRDVGMTRSLAEEAVRLTSERGFAALQMIATLHVGWCDVADGRIEEGRATARDAFDEYTKSGQRISRTSYGLLLVEAHLACGDVAAANETLDRSFEFAEETGERISEYELHRLRGECVLAGTPSTGQKARAAEYFARAIEIAAARNVLLYELRAATSLLRLVATSARERERVVCLVERFDAANDCADARLARGLLADTA